MSPIEAAVLAERERWITSTRGRDLPKEAELAKHAPKRGRSTESLDRAHAKAMARQRAKRERRRQRTTYPQARKALDLYERGADIGTIADALGTTRAQAGRLLSLARQWRRVGP